MKSKVIGKKQLLVFSLVCALGLAVFVNWYYTNQFNQSNEPEVTEKHNLGEAQFVNSNSLTEDSDQYFTQAKLNRTKAHDESTNHLKSIINDANTDKDTKELAQKQLVSISEQIKIETDIENLIKAQLKSECLVTYNVDSIEVIVPKKSIDEKSVMKIKNIILSKTQISEEKIIIIEFE